MAEKHTILEGKVHVYRRNDSPIWHCSTYLKGKNWRVSTKEESLSKAKDWAEDWYFGLKDKGRRGELLSEKTFKDAADQFITEYEVLTEGERNARWVKDHYRRVRSYLVPYFGKMGLSTINAGTVQEYRVSRMTPEEGKKLPSRSTLHHETVTLRLVLKTAVRHRWLAHLPDISQPYKKSAKVVHRAWFTPEEYKQLYQATRAHAQKARDASKKAQEGEKAHRVWLSEQLHDKILFLANTGLRPDEANWLEYRDVEIVKDKATGQKILEIQVRGKRGVGYCKSTSGAVFPFERMVARNKPKPTDKLFPVDHKKQFNGILDKIGLKLDREGNRRTLYSLRHSYISFRLLEGADIYQVAKNCRTSVEMIEKHYAVHLKNRLDAAAINVRKARPPKKPKAETLDLFEN
ncbi:MULTISPECIES: site-specific integrase [unclassified Mesorhizobium]|uniref:tyrosine-type recombinase/integrase n=1 Tax=unclassified Mesorhizobium TaxID=325217 RepID=UPI001093C7A8|nr:MULTISPECIES: site-specific integrase [unclassified Mesorhizobium]TGT91939.1 site-specific integrase [Mesorhizobium sp. M8A.F.Ca.ET.161.01.1.1]TGV44964.1 site-specific integrase [Mesorhizobium sp. M8A.F.Ca.ET.142.01.1.1]